MSTSLAQQQVSQVGNFVDSETQPSAVSRSKRPRLIQLDILRGIAVFMVLCSHQIGTPSGPEYLRQFAWGLHNFGQTAVDLFFVLSGFLIGGLLISEIRETGDLNVKRFLVRRGFKIWPAYYVFLVVAFAHMMWHHGVNFHSGIDKLWPFVFNLQNYLGPFDLLTHTWSLALEEHFYLLLPILLWVMIRNRKKGIALRALPVVIIFALVVCTTWRFWNAMHRSQWQITDASSTHLRIDSIFFGVLISYFYQTKPAWFLRLSKYPWTLLCLCCLLVAHRWFLERVDVFVWTIGFTLCYIGYGCGLITFVHAQPGRGWLGKLMDTGVAKMLASVGLYSYSIYLWHFEFVGPFVMAKVVPLLPESLKWPLGMMIYISGAILFGVLAAKLIELPMLSVRDRLFPRVSGMSPTSVRH